tara:strand:- start:70 stop:237 length:168 start_codon:yes stop_codon:yes gene_type:complete
MSKRYNDTGWMIFGEGQEYDDEGLQTYFEETILEVRFWENKEGHQFYDVILDGDQ